MEPAHQVRHEVVDRETSIILGVSIFAISTLIAVVLVAGGPRHVVPELRFSDRCFSVGDAAICFSSMR